MKTEDTSPQLPSIGWLGQGGNDGLSTFGGWQANVRDYFEVPHRTLILRLAPTARKGEEWYIVCHSCESLPNRAYWTINRLECIQIRHHRYVLRDEERCIRVECNAPRLFDRPVFVKWAGKEEWLLNPTEENMQAILRRSVEF